MITFALEDYAQVIDELSQLYPDHYAEIAIDQDVIPLSLDYDLYMRLYHEGQLHLITMRKDGMIVGYVLGMVKTHLHYKESLHCLTDLFYIKPEYRTGWNGIKLFQKYEETLKKRGVIKIMLATKCHLDRSKIFEYLGYVRQEIVYSKVIINTR